MAGDIYCPGCGVGRLDPVLEDGRIVYYCPACGGRLIVTVTVEYRPQPGADTLLKSARLAILAAIAAGGK